MSKQLPKYAIRSLIWGYDFHQYSKTCAKQPLSQKDQNSVFKTNYLLMQVISIAESAILLTFIKLPFVIKIFILSVFEWPFYTGFTVL